MIFSGLFSHRLPPEAPRPKDHPREDMPLARQMNSPFLHTQTQLQRIYLPEQPSPEWVHVRGRQWRKPVGIGMARPARGDHTPVTEEKQEHEWLNRAVQDLADCPAAAAEEGLARPSALGLSKSEAVLRGISGLVEEQPDIYPMEGGGIVIDLQSRDPQTSVLMVVERDGAGILFYRTSGKKGRARISDAAGLPDLLKQL